MPLDDHPMIWRRSGFCETGTCVEVAVLPDRVLLRDSAHPEIGPLEFSREAWTAFLAAIGEFEPPAAV